MLRFCNLSSNFAIISNKAKAFGMANGRKAAYWKSYRRVRFNVKAHLSEIYTDNDGHCSEITESESESLLELLEPESSLQFSQDVHVDLPCDAVHTGSKNSHDNVRLVEDRDNVEDYGDISYALSC